MATYDVDTDGGGSYSSMSAAEAALPAIPTEVDTITCTGSAQDTITCLINNDRTTYRLTVSGDQSYEMKGSSSFVVRIASDNVTVEKIKIETGQSNYVAGIRIETSGAYTGVKILRNWIDQKTNTGTQTDGVFLTYNASGNRYALVANNVIIGQTDKGIDTSSGMLDDVINNTIVGCLVGIDRPYNAENSLINNAMLNNTTDFAGTFAGGAGVTEANNASDDATASGTGSIINVPYTTATFVNVTAGSEDFQLADTDSDLYNAGYDASSFISDDYDGTSRPQATTWDIGAYEYVNSGVTTSGAVTFPQLTVAGVADTEYKSDGAVTLPQLTVAGVAAGVEVYPSSGAVTLPQLIAAGVAETSIVTAGAVSLPQLTVAGTAAVALSSAGSVSLPQLLIAGTARGVIPATQEEMIQELYIRLDLDENYPNTYYTDSNGINRIVNDLFTLTKTEVSPGVWRMVKTDT